MQIPPNTSRLKFRPLAPNDAPALAAVFNDPYARQYYPDMNLETAARWIEKNKARYRDDGYGFWALELLETGELIGDCGLVVQTVDDAQEVEIGYHIHSKHRRQGLASEAAQACLDFGFSNTDAERLISLVDKTNIASETVALRIHRERSETIRRDRPHWVYFTQREDYLMKAKTD